MLVTMELELDCMRWMDADWVDSDRIGIQSVCKVDYL